MRKPVKKYMIHFLIVLVSLCSCKKETAFYPCHEDTFWFVVMMAESGGLADKVHHEDLGDKMCPYHNKIGIDSLGLFQVSFEDGVRYGCLFKTRSDAFNPDLNNDCKNKIMASLQRKHAGENIWQVGGRYWSVMRHPKYWPNYRKEPFENLKYYAEKVGCSI